MCTFLLSGGMVLDFACLEEVMDGGPIDLNYESSRVSGRRMEAPAIHLHVIEVGSTWGLIIDRHLPQLQCMVKVNPSCAQPHVVSR
jgi:hypothetical protein